MIQLKEIGDSEAAVQVTVQVTASINSTVNLTPKHKWRNRLHSTSNLGLEAGIAGLTTASSRLND